MVEVEVEQVFDEAVRMQVMVGQVEVEVVQKVQQVQQHCIRDDLEIIEVQQMLMVQLVEVEHEVHDE